MLREKQHVLEAERRAWKSRKSAVLSSASTSPLSAPAAASRAAEKNQLKALSAALNAQTQILNDQQFYLQSTHAWLMAREEKLHRLERLVSRLHFAADHGLRAERASSPHQHHVHGHVRHGKV